VILQIASTNFIITQWNLYGFHARLPEVQNYLSITPKTPHIIWKMIDNQTAR
jgi:hypothetical protein